VDVTGVRLVMTNGAERIYTAGRAWEVDGFGDYVITDENANKIASRKRASVDYIELVYAGDSQ
jgi:hypothetical protein